MVWPLALDDAAIKMSAHHQYWGQTITVVMAGKMETKSKMVERFLYTDSKDQEPVSITKKNFLFSFFENFTSIPNVTPST